MTMRFMGTKNFGVQLPARCSAEIST